MSRYRFIAAERDHYPVRRLCQVLDVPPSGFYAWQATEQRTVESPKTPVWEKVLVKVFGFHKRCYGTRRLQVALRHKGLRIGRQGLRTAMRRQGLRALQPKQGLRIKIARVPLLHPVPFHNHFWQSGFRTKCALTS